MKQFNGLIKPQVVAAMVLIALVLLGLTHRRAITKKRDRIDAANAAIETLRNEDRRAELLERRAALLERSAALEGAIPQASEIAGLINALKRDCETIGLAEQTWSIGEPRSIGAHAGIPVDLSFDGSFPGVHELLSRIDAYQRIVRIEKLVLIADAERPSDELSVSIRIDAMVSAEESDRLSSEGSR